MNPKWKWFFEAPLSAKWRSRLELTFGVVVSGAAVVALSTAIRPDPAKVAALRGELPLVVESVPARTAEPLVEARKPEMTPQFYSAAEKGDLVAMATHYEKGMPIDYVLPLAARSGNKAAVAWLLQKGANANDRAGTIYAPVLAADPYPDIVKLLRDHGAEEPSLENAARANAPNWVEQLLAKHPKLNARWTYLVEAAAAAMSGSGEDKRRVVSMLLQHGADPNHTSGSDSALGNAIDACDDDRSNASIAAGCMDLVDLLLEYGAHVTGDALGAALSLDDDATRNALLDKLFALPIEKGVTAVALARATSVKPQDLKRVVAHGVDWAWHDGEDDAALPVREAVRRGDRDLVRAFLDAGAPVDVHFKDSTCALAEAIDGAQNNSANARIVELLVTRGASVNHRFPDGRTPLFAAAESGEIRVVNFLLDHGARVNDVVLDATPLDAAEQHNNVAAARVIHAHGGRELHPSALF